MHVSRNWRGIAARVHFYFDEGTKVLNSFKQVLYVSAAFKLLGIPIIAVVVLAPFVYAAHVMAGVWWIRHGFYKQLAEVPTIDAVAPINMWGWHMAVRLYAKLGIPMDDMDLTTMPPELRTALASFHKP